jgi:ATP-binding cassette subfamily C protein
MIKKLSVHLLGTWTADTFLTYTGLLLKTMSWRVALALVLMLCLSVTQGAQLLLLVPLMQVVGLDVGQGSVGWVADVASSALAAVGLKPTLITVLVVFALVTSILALIARWQTIYNYKLQQDFVACLRRRLYRAIANTDWLTFSKTRSSDFTHALTVELDRVGGAAYVLLGLVSNLVLITAYAILALKLSLTMTALVFAAGVVLLLLLRKRTQAARWSGEDITFATSGLHSAAIEHLSGMKTIKSYGAEERNSRVFSELADSVAQMYLRVTRNQAETGFWFTVGSAVILCAILYTSITILALPAAGFLLLLFLFNRMIPLFKSIQNYYQVYLSALPAFERVMEFQTRCEAAAEPRTTARSEKIVLRDSIRLEGVSFAYGAEEKAPAVRDLDLTVGAGKTTAIVGPSGAGKSTIADLLLGLIVPDQGRVLVDEVPLSPELARAWRSQIGYVAQDTFLFNDSVRANLLWAHPQADEEEIWQALKLAAAEEFVAGLPEGLETILGDRGVRLSGGERQRLALARALLRRPSMLILDEATSALDSENERRILGAMEKLHGRITILIITHRLSTVRVSDEIHVLEQGRRVEVGDWATLIRRKGGRFYALANAQNINNGRERVRETF